MGNSCGTMLVTTRIATIGITLNMSNQNGHVAFIYILVHENGVTTFGSSQIHQMLVIFAVVIDDLATMPELIKKLSSQHTKNLLFSIFAVKAVGANQQDVFFFHTSDIQFLQHQLDGNFSVGSSLLTAFYSVWKYDGNFGAFFCQLGKGLHTDGIPQGLESPLFQLSFWNAGRICHCFARNKDVSIVRKLGIHHTVAVFKRKFHVRLLYL